MLLLHLFLLLLLDLPCLALLLVGLGVPFLVVRLLYCGETDVLEFLYRQVEQLLKDSVYLLN